MNRLGQMANGIWAVVIGIFLWPLALPIDMGLRMFLAAVWFCFVCWVIIIWRRKKRRPARTRHISQDVKIEVASRDGGVCRNCGSGESLQFDHIVPFSKGGSNEVNNIQLLCQNCNLRKSDTLPLTWEGWYGQQA